MYTLIIKIFLTVLILFFLILSIFLYTRLYENRMIKKYGSNYNEDHFRAVSSNKECLVSVKEKEKYNLPEDFRYKGIDINTCETIFSQGNRERDKAVYITEDGRREDLEIFCRRIFKETPTRNELNHVLKYLNNITRVGLIKLEEGYFLLFMIPSEAVAEDISN